MRRHCTRVFTRDFPFIASSQHSTEKRRWGGTSRESCGASVTLATSATNTCRRKKASIASAATTATTHPQSTSRSSSWAPVLAATTARSTCQRKKHPTRSVGTVAVSQTSTRVPKSVSFSQHTSLNTEQSHNTLIHIDFS